MYKVYDEWPLIAREQYGSDLEPIDFDKITHIVFAGHGNSYLNDLFIGDLNFNSANIGQLINDFKLGKRQKVA